MLSTAAGRATTQAEGRHDRLQQRSLVFRRIWLPKLVYDGLPYFYLASGAAAFFATLYITQWFWVLPHYVLFSLACLHFGVIVYRRRHGKGNSDAEGGR